MALSLIAVWFLIGETHEGQQLTPALPLPHVRYGLSLLLLEAFCTPGIDYICRQVYRQSHTSGKAGGSEKGEPLKAVRYCEPLKAVGA